MTWNSVGVHYQVHETFGLKFLDVLCLHDCLGVFRSLLN